MTALIGTLERVEADRQALLSRMRMLEAQLIESETGRQRQLDELAIALERTEADSQERLRDVKRRETRIAELTEQLTHVTEESQRRVDLAHRLHVRVSDLSNLLRAAEDDSQRQLSYTRDLEARLADVSERLERTELDSERRLARIRDYAAQTIALKERLAERTRGGTVVARSEQGGPSVSAPDVPAAPPREPVRPGESPATITRSNDRVTIIRPPGSLVRIDLHELWRFRHLFTILVWRSIRVEFDAMRLGSLWAVARPLIFAYVFAFFRGLSTANTYVELPYLLWVYSGLLLWTYFTDATSNSSVAIRIDTALLTRIYYPRILTPLVPIVSGLVTLAIGCIPMAAMMTWYEVWPGRAIILLPVLVVLCAALALGIGTLVSSLSIEDRDWERVLTFALSVGLWLSPVIYAPGMIPERLHGLFILNPANGLLLGFRAALFSSVEVPIVQLVYSAVATAFILATGVIAFRRTEAQLADRL
jgi:lipopolysaccharide transport system permease protein